MRRMVGRPVFLMLLAVSAICGEPLRLKRDGNHQHYGQQYAPIVQSPYAQPAPVPVATHYRQTQYVQPAPVALPQQYVQPAPVAVPQYSPPAPVAVPQYVQPAPVPVQPAPVAVPQYSQPAPVAVPQYVQPAPVPVQPAPVALPQYSQPLPAALPEQVVAPVAVPALAPLPQAYVPPATEAPVAQVQDVVAPATSAPVEAPVTGLAYASAPAVTVPPVSEDQVSATDAPLPAAQALDTASSNATSQQAKEESQWAKGSIPYVLEQIGFNSFNDLIILAGIENMFEKEGPFTVLVPPDAAFDALSNRFGGQEAALEQFNKNPEALNALLKSHVIPGIVPSNVLSHNFVGRSIIGSPLRVKFYEAEDNEWKPLRVATVNGARVLRTDIPASNGLIHIVDRPMFPVPTADIYNTLKNDPEQKFKTLVSAIEQSGLVQVLANPLAGPFTVFAPTDKAFSMVSRAELAPILADPARLAKLLQRHVVQDLVYTTGLQGFQKAYALNFELLYIFHAKGMTKVNGAMVIDSDISAVNGVIHSIDSVLGV